MDTQLQQETMNHNQNSIYMDISVNINQAHFLFYGSGTLRSLPSHLHYSETSMENHIITRTWNYQISLKISLI
jgi:hypothetical protein